MAIRWDKFTVKSQQAMQEAQNHAADLGNPEVQPVHLLLSLLEDREGVVPAVLEKIGTPLSVSPPSCTALRRSCRASPAPPLSRASARR